MFMLQEFSILQISVLSSTGILWSPGAALQVLVLVTPVHLFHLWMKEKEE